MEAPDNAGRDPSRWPGLRHLAWEAEWSEDAATGEAEGRHDLW